MIFSGTASSVNTMRQSQNALSLLTKLFFFTMATLKSRRVNFNPGLNQFEAQFPCLGIRKWRLLNETLNN